MGMKYRDPETGQFKDLKVKTSDTLPIGTQVAYGGTVPPTGWLICDGSAVSRTTYAELFKVIGTSYGEGDGSTTFNLPNKKGRVSAGYDSTNSKFNAIGKKLGEETHTLTAQELASHNHNGTTDWAGEHAHTFNGYAPDRMATGSSGYAFVSNSQSHTDVIDSSGSHQHTFTTNNTGGNQPHNNIQPTEVDNWIIKAFQSIGVVGKVVNTKTNSDNDTYSCDYINANEITINNDNSLASGNITLTNKYNKVDIICAVNTVNVNSRITISVYNGLQTEMPCIVYIDGNLYLALRTFELNDKVLSWSDCTCYGITGNNSTLNNQNTCEKPLKAICYYKQG